MYDRVPLRRRRSERPPAASAAPARQGSHSNADSLAPLPPPPLRYERGLRTAQPEPDVLVGELLRAVRRARFGKGVYCPHCGGRRTHRWGSFSGRQRYRCAVCGRTFSDLTRTPLAYTKHLHLWAGQFECMAESVTVRAAAARLGIDKNTAWRWRQQVLAGLRSHDLATPLSGYVEVGETTFLHSEKGSRFLTRPPYPRPQLSAFLTPQRPRVWVMLARDQFGGALAEIVGRRRPRVPHVRDVLLPRCARDAVLVTSSGPLGPYRTVVTGRDQRWDLAVARRFGDDVRRLREWMRRFHGVATKYLERYLAWNHALQVLADRAAWSPTAWQARTWGGSGWSDLQKRTGAGTLLWRSLTPQFPGTAADHPRAPPARAPASCLTVSNRTATGTAGTGRGRRGTPPSERPTPR